jgi:hypothetical protein
VAPPRRLDRQARRLSLTAASPVAAASPLTRAAGLEPGRLASRSAARTRPAVDYPASWTVDEGREGGEAGIRVGVQGRRDEEGLYPRLPVARQEREFVNAGQAGGALATEPVPPRAWSACRSSGSSARST